MYHYRVILTITGRLVLKKTVFSALVSKLNTRLVNKGWYGMFFARGIWCVADVSSVSPSSLLRRKANAQNISYTPYPTGEKHVVPTFVDQTRIILTIFAKLLKNCLCNRFSNSTISFWYHQSFQRATVSILFHITLFSSEFYYWTTCSPSPLPNN